MIGEQPVVILTVRPHACGREIDLRDPGEGMPQSLRFDLSLQQERRAFLNLVRQSVPERIEILDPMTLPKFCISLLTRSQIPYDIFVADAEFLNESYGLRPAASLRSHTAGGTKRNRAAAEIQSERERRRRRAYALAAGAEQLIAANPQAEAMVKRFLPEKKLIRIDPIGLRHERRQTPMTKREPHRLGLVPLRATAEEQQSALAMMCELQMRRPDVSTTILGATLDDLRLMRIGDTFVTGKIDAQEFTHLIEAYELGFVFLSAGRPLFGHPLQTAALQSSLPLAYFDWSDGQAEPRTGDLALNPRLPPELIAKELARWIPERRNA